MKLNSPIINEESYVSDTTDNGKTYDLGNRITKAEEVLENCDRNNTYDLGNRIAIVNNNCKLDTTEQRFDHDVTQITQNEQEMKDLVAQIDSNSLIESEVVESYLQESGMKKTKSDSQNDVIIEESRNETTSEGEKTYEYTNQLLHQTEYEETKDFDMTHINPADDKDDLSNNDVKRKTLVEARNELKRKQQEMLSNSFSKEDHQFLETKFNDIEDKLNLLTNNLLDQKYHCSNPNFYELNSPDSKKSSYMQEIPEEKHLNLGKIRKSATSRNKSRPSTSRSH